MVELDDKEAAELESLQDEVNSRLARRYGLSKGEIAKLAVKRYGGEIMTEETEKILSNVRGVVGGGGDTMDKMMTWEMIKDMRSQRANQPQPVQQPQPQQLQQPVQEKMNMQDMMMMMIMPQMAKAMGGGEDEMVKIFKLKMLMGDGDGKDTNMEKLEQMMKEERAAAEARTQQMMDMMLGRQEAEKIREKEEKYRKELEQRVQNAEYLARHPTQPTEVIPSAMEKVDEGLDMLSHTKSRMEGLGMVSTPPSAEDKKFELDKMGIGHQQNVETEAVRQIARSADKMSDTVDKTTNKVIDFMAEEQKVKSRQLELMSPEERAAQERQYAMLADQVRAEEGAVEQPSGEVDFKEEDDLDVQD